MRRTLVLKNAVLPLSKVTELTDIYMIDRYIHRYIDGYIDR